MSWSVGYVLEDAWPGAGHVLALPTDRPVPAMQTQAGDHPAHELTAELSAAVTALGQRMNAIFLWCS